MTAESQADAERVVLSHARLDRVLDVMMEWARGGVEFAANDNWSVYVSRSRGDADMTKARRLMKACTEEMRAVLAFEGDRAILRRLEWLRWEVEHKRVTETL